MHYLDEGRKGSFPVLLLHGVPAWSYIYRKMIPVLSDAGFRVIAPDLVGFGKSDKPDNRSWHSLQNHIDYIDGLIQYLDISDIVLFGQDWGSMIGLREAASNPEKFSGIIISNGGLPEGNEKVPWQFRLWKLFARFSPFFPVGRIIEAGSLKNLTIDEKQAYKSPFPAGRHKKGPRALPGRVSLKYNHPDSAANREAWAVPWLSPTWIL